MSDPYQEVEDADEQDYAQFQVMLAEQIAAILQNADPNTTAPAGFTVEVWETLIEAAVGVAILMFLLRSARNMAEKAGVPPVQINDAVDQLVRDQKEQTVQQIAEQMGQTYTSLQDWANPPLPTLTPETLIDPEPAPPTPEPAKPQPTPDQVYRRIQIFAGQAARGMTTSARERLRYELARRLGATHKVWRTRLDDRVRVSHGALENEALPIQEPYITILGSALQYPGDPRGVIGDVIQCRCHLSYRIPMERYSGGSLVMLENPDA